MDLAAIRREIEALLRSTQPDVMDAWRKPEAEARRKPDGTFVTPVDLRLEDRIAGLLLALDPRWGVVGEEGGTRRAGNPTWFVDPLDGTMNFIRRLPLFATQLCLVEGNRPLLGMIYDPLQDEMAWAAEGEGAWREGRRLAVSDRPLPEALVMADLSHSGVFVETPSKLQRLRRAVFRLRALGCIALQLRDVASGRAEAYIASRAHPSHRHDFAPGVLMVREAGGVVTNIEGGDPFAAPTSIVAAPRALHPALCALLT